MTGFSEELIVKSLLSFGFSEISSYIYLYLILEGPHGARDIREALNLDKRNFNRSLKKLQKKGIIKVLGSSNYFSAISFDKVYDLLIKAKMDQAKYLMKNKEELLSIWKSIIID